MTEQHRIIWTINRFVSPIVVFAVLFFALWKFEVFAKGTAFGVAAVIGLSDYFMMTWIMKRLGQG